MQSPQNPLRKELGPIQLPTLLLLARAERTPLTRAWLMIDLKMSECAATRSLSTLRKRGWIEAEGKEPSGTRPRIAYGLTRKGDNTLTEYRRLLGACKHQDPRWLHAQIEASYPEMVAKTPLLLREIATAAEPFTAAYLRDRYSYRGAIGSLKALERAFTAGLVRRAGKVQSDDQGHYAYTYALSDKGQRLLELAASI